MTRADVAALLRDAKMRNVNRNVTGLLLQIDNRFVQYIEGPRPAVEHLRERIESDPRHRDVQLLFEGPISERLFGDWAMGFSDLSGSSLLQERRSSLLKQVLEQPPPADRRGRSNDVFHRFWARCAQSLPV